MASETPASVPSLTKTASQLNLGSIEDDVAPPPCPFASAARVFTPAVVGRLTMLKNIGVQGCAYQTEVRAAVSAVLDSAALTEADAYFAKHLTNFIGGDAPDKADVRYFSECQQSLGLLFNTNVVAGTDVSALRRWFLSCAEHLPHQHCIGEVRIGGQIDVRPISSVVAAESDVAYARNKDTKVGLSQRQKEKAAKKKGKKGGASSNNSAAAAAAPATASAPVVTRPKPESPAAAHAILLERLKAMGVTPYKEESPDLAAKKPVGHSTHNLFVKDKKKKKLFLIMGRQNAKIDLKVTAKAIGMKQLRMSRDAATVLCTAGGCITVLKLLADTELKCTLVRDASLTKQASLRICTGCSDALDHSQHNVVDITPAQIDELLRESGHAATQVEIEFEDL